MDERLRPLFDKYNRQLKPLVAKIEGRYEKFETPLLVNLMSFWETIVQLHLAGKEHEIDTLLKQADQKLNESISQSYVYMISGYKDDVKDFEKHTSKQARRSFKNGLFLGEYKKLKKEANDNIRLTKKTRHRRWNLSYSYPDFSKSYNSNEKAYHAYREISTMISDQNTAAILYRSERMSTVWSLLGWVVSIGISVLAGLYVKPFIDIITRWIEN
ncbi:MAG: hypothetical protein IJ700_07285 [Bacteroidaceae bacterium]|nr:hypothetical protein [Bacteroidaceae bacterium]